MGATQVHRPGRLGDPDMTLGTDPRADRRMVAVMAELGLDGHGEPTPVNADSPLESIYDYCNVGEPGFQMMFDVLYQGLSPIEGVERNDVTITGPDGNEISLYIHRPAGVDGPLPAIFHIHGGGMVILTAADANFGRWRDELASIGLVAVGVEYRNGGGSLGNHPFPAGLNDCGTALQWVAANKADLGISTITVSGESGGGNLTLATTLKAKRDGYLDVIDGVFAQCPYISGMYANPPGDLPSLHENDQYFLGCENMGALVKAYDPAGENATNPLAWPMHVSVEELEGMPPHVISVNELDPLRDEGLTYYRKLTAAGNTATARTINGTCHAGDVIFRTAMPEVYASTAAALRDFAYSL